MIKRFHVVSPIALNPRSTTAILPICQVLRDDPEVIEIGMRMSPADTVTHALYPVAKDQKFELLQAMLERTDFDSVLIFSRTKVGADMVANRLKSQKHSVAVLHSNRNQNDRIEALEGFKNGNYDLPYDSEAYVHRIGRTGRAQKVGDAFTIMVAEELDHVRSIERFIGQKITRLKLENFDYLYTALFDEGSMPAGSTATGGRHHGGYSFGRRKRR